MSDRTMNEGAGLRGLTVVPDVMGALAKAVQLGVAIASLDPEHECEHGSLPTDPRPRCSCFTTAAPVAVQAAPAAPAARPGRRPPPMQGRVIGRERSPGGVAMQRILCQCGQEWTRPSGTPGRVPLCQDCRS